MSKMKQMVLICLTLMLILTGCASKTNNQSSGTQTAPSTDAATPSSSQETDGGSKASSDVTLTISRWAGPHADDQAGLLKDFEKETGIKVKMDAIDYGQLHQKQVLNMSGKTGQYDLVWAQEIWVPEYAKTGYLLPLDDMVKDTSLTGSDWDFSDFNKGAIQVDTVDGKLYALPTFAQTPIMVYNKDMFAKEGLQPPKTWDETLKVAKHFHDKGTGIALPAKQGLAAVDVYSALIRSNDGGYFGNDGKLTLTSDANIEALQFWKDLAAVSMKGSTNWHWDEVNKAVQFGQAPFGYTISGIVSQLEDPANSKVAGKVGYAPLPYSKHPFGTSTFWSWCVTADSKHPKEAFKLAAWLTSKKIEKAQSLKNGQIANRQSLFSDKDLAGKAPWLAAVGEALAQSDTEPLGANAPKLLEAMQNSLSAVASKGSDPKQEMEKAQRT
jgi:multiple sugar transport system substrate-binding protein